MVLLLLCSAIQAPTVAERHRVWCYPLQLYHAVPHMPVIDYLLEGDTVVLKYKDDRQRINAAYFHKLVSWFFIVQWQEFV